MRKAEVLVNEIRAGVLQEPEKNKRYLFLYDGNYSGPPVSLTMPVREAGYEFTRFPPFFDGLLPEGFQLDGLLRIKKIDRDDLFAQLMAVGGNMVGTVTVRELS